MITQTAFKPLGFLHALTSAWTRYRNRRAVAAELQALGDAELERVVRDAGLTFGDLLRLARKSGDSAALLYRRLEQAGIDMKSIEPMVMRDLQRCCSMCEAKTQCTHELEDKPKAAAWPAYCPNRVTIEALGAVQCH
jgi:hypothetical protein